MTRCAASSPAAWSSGCGRRSGGHGAPGIEPAHTVRAPEDVAALLADAERDGGTIVRPATRPQWGGTSGAVAAPDGYVGGRPQPGGTITDDGSVHI